MNLMKLLLPNGTNTGTHKMDTSRLEYDGHVSQTHNAVVVHPVNMYPDNGTLGGIFNTLNWEKYSDDIDDVDDDDDEVFDDEIPTGESQITSDQTHPVVFRWRGTGEQVLLSGSYDNWQTKIPLVRSCNEMFTVVDVAEGIHQYKFNVDGEWLYEPSEPTIDENESTCRNNVVKLSSEDCDVFAALAIDDNSNEQPVDKNIIGSPPSGYSQYIPPRDQGTFNYFRHGPPLLPPHLLQSVLNADVPNVMDPTSLPKPNHVTLNHAFTLSIRDGVMVLSGTHRFREKCITTVLYRPL